MGLPLGIIGRAIPPGPSQLFGQLASILGGVGHSRTHLPERTRFIQDSNKIQPSPFQSGKNNSRTPGRNHTNRPNKPLGYSRGMRQEEKKMQRRANWKRSTRSPQGPYFLWVTMRIQSPTSLSESPQVGFHSLPARPQVLAQNTGKRSGENILPPIHQRMNPFPTGQMSQRPRIANGTTPQSWSSWRMMTAPLCPGRPGCGKENPQPESG